MKKVIIVGCFSLEVTTPVLKGSESSVRDIAPYVAS